MPCWPPICTGCIDMTDDRVPRRRRLPPRPEPSQVIPRDPGRRPPAAPPPKPTPPEAPTVRLRRPGTPPARPRRPRRKRAWGQLISLSVVLVVLLISAAGLGG